MDSIDETVLADFLAGRLSPARRAEVVQHLATHESSRELLRMAYQALEADRTEAETPHPTRRPARLDRPAMPVATPARRVRLPRAWRAAAVVVALVGTLGILQLTLAPTPDSVRNTDQTTTLEARISPRTLAISWESVPEADHYEVMVWDQEAAREVASEAVRGTRLPADSPFAVRVRERVQAGRDYRLQVTAFDATNRRLVASPLIAFRYEG